MLSLFNQASGLSIVELIDSSRDDHDLDVKTQYPNLRHYKNESDAFFEGYLFDGKYITLREAGNILFGANLAQHNIPFFSAMPFVGLYNQASNGGDKTGVLRYCGESSYSGRGAEYGYDLFRRTGRLTTERFKIK